MHVPSRDLAQVLDHQHDVIGTEYLKSCSNLSFSFPHTTTPSPLLIQQNGGRVDSASSQHGCERALPLSAHSSRTPQQYLRYLKQDRNIDIGKHGYDGKHGSPQSLVCLSNSPLSTVLLLNHQIQAEYLDVAPSGSIMQFAIFKGYDLDDPREMLKQKFPLKLLSTLQNVHAVVSHGGYQVCWHPPLDRGYHRDTGREPRVHGMDTHERCVKQNVLQCSALV